MGFNRFLSRDLWATTIETRESGQLGNVKETSNSCIDEGVHLNHSIAACTTQLIHTLRLTVEVKTDKMLSRVKLSNAASL